MVRIPHPTVVPVAPEPAASAVVGVQAAGQRTLQRELKAFGRAVIVPADDHVEVGVVRRGGVGQQALVLGSIVNFIDQRALDFSRQVSGWLALVATVGTCLLDIR